MPMNISAGLTRGQKVHANEGQRELQQSEEPSQEQPAGLDVESDQQVTPPATTDTNEFFIVVQPIMDQTMVFKLGSTIQEMASSAITNFYSSLKGVAIRLILRTGVPIMSILMRIFEDMNEVDEVRLGLQPGEKAFWDVPGFRDLRVEKTVQVVMKTQ